jgi:hypothetical protein
MKWYNSDKTQYVDLSRVSYWEYSPQQSDGYFLRSTLTLSVDGYGVKFTHADADEIYSLLLNKKEVL